MSQFIQDFRAKYPQYQDVADDQLVSALHAKYYSDIPIEQFNQRIGYQPPAPQPIQQQPVDLQDVEVDGFTGAARKVEPLAQQPIQQPAPQAIPEQQVDGFTGAAMKAPEEQSMMELVGSKLANWGKGAGERSGDVGGALLDTIVTVGEGLEKKYPMGGFVWEDGDIIPSYLSPEEWAAQDAPQILNKGADVLKGIDLGYQEQVGWEDVKKSFSEGGPLGASAYADVLEYGLEQGIKSVPDMVSAIYALPAYVFARSGEIGEQRAQNKGKQEAELEDVLEAAPFAVAASLLDRIGAKGITQAGKEELGKEILKAGLRESAKRSAKAGGKALSKEAATEAIQEGMIEYVGERYGTDVAMDWKEALDRAAAGAVAGGVFGGTAGTTTAVVNEINYSPEKVIAQAMEEEVTKAEPTAVEQQVIDSLRPERAQVQQEVKPEEKQQVTPKESERKTEPKQEVKPDQVAQEEFEIDKSETQQPEPVAFDVPVEGKQDARVVEDSLPEQRDQQERSVSVDETQRAGREVEPDRVDATAESARSGEQVTPVGNAVTEPALSLTERQIDNLNYTNGIKDVATRLNVPFEKGESAGSIRSKIKGVVLGKRETIKPEEYKAYKKDISKPQLHGTSSKISDLQEFTYATQNIYGQGLYTTDSPDIAKGYSSKGEGKEPTIYEVKFKREPKLYDMEQPLDSDTKSYLESLESDAIDVALDEASTLREVYDIARQSSEGMMISADVLQESFKAISDHLRSRGFDGIRHVGGMFTKQKPHNVEIIFNPKEIIELSEAKADEQPQAKPEEKTTPAQPEKKSEVKAEQPEAAVSDYGTSAAKSFASFRESVASQTATAEQIKADAENLVANKQAVIKELTGMKNSDITKMFEFPKQNMRKDKLVQSAWEVMLYSHVLKSGAVTTFEGSQTLEDLVMKQVNEQTKLDIEKAYDNGVAEPTMNRKGEITYPSPKEDVNTKQYNKLDTLAYEVPKDGERVFHAPGHNFIGLFRSTGIPERREFVTIEGRKVKIPEKPQRIEPIMSKMVQIAGRRIYFGKIKGKSQEGFYRPNVGEIRTRRKNDVEVLAHELAHYLDVYSNITLPNFQKLYKDPKFVSEVEALSYADADPKIQKIEGFAEFVRLWLTNANEAQNRAPNFYEVFTNTLARDRKLLNPMRDMQDLMHKFYFQGPDKLGQALIGKDTSFIQAFDEWKYRRDSRIRQQVIDRFHAARKVEQELTRKVGTVQESAWKQFRLANGGAEGISDYIMNYGTVQFDEKGDLKRNGASLHEVLAPVKTIKLQPEHEGEAKVDLLMRYFAGRRALELHRQKRENLIPKETAKEWARLGSTYPAFESIHKEYQAFNDRMMDFYQEAGMITPEGRKAMQSMNKDYVPFNRIRDQLAGGSTATTGFKKLKGGTANLNDILVNIQDGVTANVRAALNNRAKQRLYQYISGHKDGAIFATKIAPDSRKVQVYADEMQAKIGKVLEMNGIELEGDLDLATKGLLEFWQHGVTPKVNESGNIVDSVIINGKPKYYEVQDPLLQEMLLSMNPESYSSFMNVMFGVKNFFTRMITLGIEFTGANLVRDTTGAAFLSKNNFKPFVDSFKGMYSFITKDQYYQDFLRSGGGYSSRLEATTKEGTARRRVAVDEFGVMTIPERLLSSIDNIASAFEYGTRIGEFRLAKKNMKSDMDAGFDAREISTDFSVLGANRFLTGYIRTVPFLNAMIQSQDRVFREAVVSKKYDGNPTALAMKAFLGITVPTLILYLVNKDDEDYQQIPDYEKRTNWHIKIGDGQFIKIPRPYDVGFVYATMPELFAKYVEDDKGKEFADGMIWTLTQMYGIDGSPAMMTGWWDLVRNEKWTGSPVVPQSLSNVEATEQYTSNTSETFVRMGEALGVSPIKAEHMFKAYTGYLGGYLLWGTDHMLWDEDKFGEKPDRKASDNIFLRRFLTPDVRPATASMEKFFDLKEKSDRVVATFRQTVDVRRQLAQREGDPGKFKDDRFFGLSAKEKEVLFALNDSMNQLIKLMYGKEGIKTAELKIKYDPNLSGAEKREQLDQLWLSRNKAFMQYYQQANQALQKAKREAEQEK